MQEGKGEGREKGKGGGMGGTCPNAEFLATLLLRF